jgi:hypothetical protein
MKIMVYLEQDEILEFIMVNSNYNFKIQKKVQLSSI